MRMRKNKTCHAETCLLRPSFTWRKSGKVWDGVKYCSDRCRSGPTQHWQRLRGRGAV